MLNVFRTTTSEKNVNHLYKKYYYSNLNFVDGTSQFHSLCSEYIVRGSLILEIGSGPANATSRFAQSRGLLIGVDTSREIRTNHYLSQAVVYDGAELPFEASVFDACISDFVLEHIADPKRHLQDVARVLKKGGVYCFRTPNLRHYIPFTSRLLPHSVHLLLANRARGLDAYQHDPYPTVYKANTRSRLCDYSNRFGLLPLVMKNIEPEPSYGRASRVLFYPMMAYERLVNAVDFLEPFRVNILAVLQRQ